MSMTRSHGRVLVLGLGAREHAMVWQLRSDPSVTALFAWPANAGISELADIANICEATPSGIAGWCADEQIEVVFVGSEAYLADGIADALDAVGVGCVGPTREAAQLESSKSWAKTVCTAAGIPIAPYATFDDVDNARAHCHASGAPLVIKADGLAGGKGAVVCSTIDEIDSTLDEFMVKLRFGAAGERIVVEQFLQGFECSFMFFTDGKSLAVMPTSQDHKPVFDGDAGPNTGGMGAYTPVTALTKDDETSLVGLIGEPLLDELQLRNIDYRGIVCANIMITPTGPVLLEFNARLGDPEAEIVMPMLLTPLLSIGRAIVAGKLADVTVEWRPVAALSVAMTVAGYPDEPRLGDVILGANSVQAGESYVFHGGTSHTERGLETASGRAIVVAATGPDLPSARATAYDRVGRVAFDGEHHRTDIGFRSLDPQPSTSSDP